MKWQYPMSIRIHRLGLPRKALSINLMSSKMMSFIHFDMRVRGGIHAHNGYTELIECSLSESAEVFILAVIGGESVGTAVVLSKVH